MRLSYAIRGALTALTVAALATAAHVEADAAAVSIGGGRFGAAAGAGDGVEIDIVHHDAIIMILEVHFDRIANLTRMNGPGTF